MLSNRTDWGEVLVSGFSWQGSVESEPIHRSSYISHAVKGDGLVHRASGQHTIQVHTINFNGNIAIEGTLNTDPCVATWIPAPLTNTATGITENILGYVFVPPVPGVPYSGETIQRNDFYIATGQFAWLRANISNVTLGIVDLVKIAF
jgi:hypothetical protein